MGAIEELGEVVITNSAGAVLPAVDVQDALEIHHQGGTELELPLEIRRANAAAMENPGIGTRFSLHLDTGGMRFWICTSPKMTTILLDGEFGPAPPPSSELRRYKPPVQN